MDVRDQMGDGHGKISLNVQSTPLCTVTISCIVLSIQSYNYKFSEGGIHSQENCKDNFDVRVKVLYS
jgi:hypothetical protein